jgi:hypothetical protein
MDTSRAAHLVNAVDDVKLKYATLTVLQERLEAIKLSERKTLRTMTALLEQEGVSVSVDAGVVSNIEDRSLPEEIRALLVSKYPSWMTPKLVRRELETMGRNLDQYPNPQSAVQVALTRMADSGADPAESRDRAGRKEYRCPGKSHLLIDVFALKPASVGAGTKQLLSALNAESETKK